MRHDDVGCVVDEAQRFVQHRQRRRRLTGCERGANVDEILPQPLFVGFGALELGDEAVDVALRGVRRGVHREAWTKARMPAVDDGARLIGRGDRRHRIMRLDLRRARS